MSPDVAVVLQQLVNGLSLGMMYALLALGFTMVYGIIELINFAHFNVFMAGSFFGLWFLAWLGYGRNAAPLGGATLAFVFIGAFLFTMLTTGLLGAIIERVCLKPLRGVSGTAPMITTIGVSLVIQSLILYASNFANNVPFPALIPNERWGILGSTVEPNTLQRSLGMSAGKGTLLAKFVAYRIRLCKMSETPMVVIIGAVPETPRNGFKHTRSMTAPRMPVVSMVKANAATRTRTRVTPESGAAFLP